MNASDTNGHNRIVAIGHHAMYHCQYSDDNVAVGSSALGNLKEGRTSGGAGSNSANTAIGHAAGLGIYSSNASIGAAMNTAIGYRAMGGSQSEVNTGSQIGESHSYNTMIGAYVDVATDGSAPTMARLSCTVIGYAARAGVFGSVVNGTTVIGANAGFNCGDDCVVIGEGADVGTAGEIGTIVIGAGAIGIGGSGSITLGNTNTHGIYTYGDVVAYYSSDIRLKENILKIDNALDKIQLINGITFK